MIEPNGPCKLSFQETIKGSTVKDAIAFATKKYTLDPEEDLNVLDDKALEVRDGTVTYGCGPRGVSEKKF